MPDLSDVLVWTRMQTEAGEGLELIIARKERERLAAGGVFCWGVGNPPARSVRELAMQGRDVDVVFSVMKTRPKAQDTTPEAIVTWRSYFDLDGVERPLPGGSVTSRAHGRGAHYALICRSDAPLELGDFGPFDPSVYRNVSESGKLIGASQVTALLRRVAPEGADASYRINLRAKLTGSYWVKLGDPGAPIAFAHNPFKAPRGRARPMELFMPLHRLISVSPPLGSELVPQVSPRVLHPQSQDSDHPLLAGAGRPVP